MANLSFFFGKPQSRHHKKINHKGLFLCQDILNVYSWLKMPFQKKVMSFVVHWLVANDFFEVIFYAHWEALVFDDDNHLAVKVFCT